MRVFDSLDDVKAYFIEKSTDADSKVQALYAQGVPTGWNDKIKQASKLAEAQATRAAYDDALATLDEVRPGFFEALEAMKGRPAFAMRGDGPSYRCPECDTYSGTFTPTEDGAFLVHGLCGREDVVASFIRGTEEYAAAERGE